MSHFGHTNLYQANDLMNSTPPTRHEQTSFTKVEDDVVVYQPLTDKYIVLNVTAGFIWEHLDGNKTIDELAHMLSLHFCVDEDRALADVNELLQMLSSRGLLAQAE